MTDLTNSEFEHSEGSIRLCLASNTFYPLFSGAALRFQRYAPGLFRRGIRMSVFTQAVTKEEISLRGLLDNGLSAQYLSPDGSQDWPLFEVVERLPITRAEVPNGWRGPPTFFSNLFTHCRHSEVDIVQFFGLPISSAPWIWRFRNRGIPTVTTCTMVGETSKNPLRRIVQRVQRRFAFNMVDLVVASTNVMKRYLLDLGVSSPIKVIPNGVDLKRFTPVKTASDKTRMRHRLQLDPAWEIILAIGSVNRRKGLDILVDAFAKVAKERPGTYLLIVGAIGKSKSKKSASFAEKLLHTIESTHAQGRVIFLGSKSNVEDYLQAADLLVFPSRREGMGNVVLEAMACGLPLITTPFIGLAEDFGIPESHYVLSKPSSTDLANDISRLLASPRARDHLGKGARNWVERTQDVNDILDRFNATYRDLTVLSKRESN